MEDRRDRAKLTVQDLAESGGAAWAALVNEGNDMQREITVPFCCDLLSFAMSRAPYGCAWVTVMGNINTLAVAALADAACIVLAEGASLDEAALLKAKEQGITVFQTDRPVFETALTIYRRIHGGAH